MRFEIWDAIRIENLTSKEKLLWFDTLNYGLEEDRGYKLNDPNIQTIQESIREDYITYLEECHKNKLFRSYFVLYDNSIIVSLCRVILNEQGQYLVEGLETHRSYRKRGYAKVLENHVFEVLKKSNVKTVFAKVSKHNEESLAFHSKMGYEVYSETDREYLLQYKIPSEKDNMLRIKLINLVLDSFKFDYKLVDYQTYYNYINFESDPIQVKIIAKVTLSNQQDYVIRILRENHITFDEIVKQNELSEIFRTHGISTPKKYNFEGELVKKIYYNNYMMYATIEDFVGNHIKKLNKRTLYECGKLLAKTHKVSEELNLFLESDGYVYNFAGKNEVVLIDKLVDLSIKFNFETDKIMKIHQLYLQKHKKIVKELSNLKRYAVQGDLNTNNISLYDNELWLFDYNIACNEYFVVMLAIDALMMIHEEEFEEYLSKEDKFRSFISGYKSVRTLNESEELLLPQIFDLADALWFSKIHIRKTSLERLLENNEIDKATTLVDEIYKSLSTTVDYT